MKQFAINGIASAVRLLVAILLLNYFGCSPAEAVDIPVGFGPDAVAIDQYSNRAVVANELSNSISIVDLYDYQVIATITVGWLPTAVAIDRVKGQALVASGWGNISIVDLNTLAVIKTTRTYKWIKAITVNDATRIAYVINYDDSVSVMDLATYKIIKTIPAKAGTDALAIDPSLNIAVIVKNNSTRASIMDLNTYRIIRTVPVGWRPTAVDINPETHTAAVVNTWGGSVTIINLQTWQTATVPVGMLPGKITVNPLDNTALVVCTAQNKLIQIDLTANRKIKTYPLNWFSRSVAVNNFTNIAGVTEDRTSALTLIQLNNPSPTITSVIPDTAQRGSQGQTIAVAGNKFITTSIATLGSSPLATTLTDNHNLKAIIPHDMLTKQGVFPVTVTTPQPGGGASNILNFSVLNPAPSITALDPGNATPGTQGLTLSVYGSGFFDDTTINLNGTARAFTLINQTKLQIALTAADLASAGSIQVMASNPTPGGGQSQPATFTVTNPVPALTSITPNSVKAGSQNVTLTLTGSNFVQSSIVSFNGTVVQASYISSTQLSISLSPAQIAAAGNYTVQVTNPEPGGGTSNVLSLTVTSASNVAPLPDGSYGKQYEDLVPQDAIIASYDTKRFSLITGLVKDNAQNALSGVSVTVLNHPEYGTARTDGTGRFSMPVNGGGNVTVVYQKAGFITSHRQVDVGWNRIATADAVTLIPADTIATTVNFDGNPATVMTHRSSTVTDGSGSRAVTMVFTGDNKAYSVDSDGKETPLTAIKTRATEFSTPEAMPAKLPPTSAFTFAAELSVDGAQKVRFDKPVVMYVENFLGFNVGTIVPVGYYDRDRGVWVPAQNGVVVRLLDTNGDGVADAYDNVGDGQPHGTLVGLSDPSVYKPGATYWRVELDHFSPWDCNWPIGTPNDAITPNPDGQPDADQQKDKDPCDKSGSYCEHRSRIVHEDIPIAGTDMTLHYASNRVQGYYQSIIVPASGASVPASLKSIIVKLEVGGRSFQQALPAAPDQKAEFRWDGNDYLGRPMNGTVTATVSSGFVYDATYYGVDGDYYRAFGQSGNYATGIRARSEVILWKQNTVSISRSGDSGYSSDSSLIEGWTLSVNHRMDPSDQALIYKGDGTISKRYNDLITTIAGNGQYGYSGDGGPATQAMLGSLGGLASDGAGNIYIAELDNPYYDCGGRLRKIDTRGIITTLAGNGMCSVFSDGPATKVSLINPIGVATDSTGNIYIAEYGKIRKLDTNGMVTTLTGNGVTGFSGDGGPAKEAQIDEIDIAVDSNGNVYFTDWQNRIRKIDTTGIITTVAGNGSPWDSGDGGPATKAGIKPSGIAVDSTGNIYVTTFDYRVRKVDTSGIITTVAGNGQRGFSGDGGPATQATLFDPNEVALDSIGNIYIADKWNNRIRKVDAAGIITTVAGCGTEGYSGDGGPAIKACLKDPNGVAVDSSGNLFIADANYRIRKVAPASAYAQYGSSGDIFFPDENGQGYVMSSTGIHKSTIDLATGKTLLTFGYDLSTRLVSVTDRFGNQTTIQRDGSGTPISITSPYGQVTSLQVDGNNDLTKITLPDNSYYSFSYSSGLLIDEYDRKGNHFVHNYDANGRVAQVNDPEGGSWIYNRTVDASVNVMSTVVTAEGNTNKYQDRTDSTGAYSSIITDPVGFVSTINRSWDSLTETQVACGMKQTEKYDLDPAYKYKYLASSTMLSPAAITRTVTDSRTYQDTNSDNLPDLITETVKLNGNNWTSVNNTLKGTITRTSPAGRTITLNYDPGTLLMQKKAVAGLLPVTYGYDSNGRLTSATVGNRTSVIFYDQKHNMDHIVTPDNKTYAFTYDDMGRPLSAILPDLSVIQYVYDSNGNTKVITNPKSASFGFDYTGVDLRKSYTTPLSANYAYVYNKERKLLNVQFPSGNLISNAYTNGQLSSTTTPEGVINYTYACSSLLGSATRGAEQIAYTYDGRLLKTDTRSGLLNQAIGYTYNNDFRIASLTYAGASQSLIYDNDGLLINAGPFTITRDTQNGLPTKLSDGTLTDTRTFSGYGEMDGDSYTIGGNNQYSWSVIRDQSGRIARKVETIGGSTDTFDYAYDDNGRLLNVKKNGSIMENYTYDADGNRRNDISRSYSYANDDHIVTAGNTTYQINVDGFLANKTSGSQTTTYQYSSRGELLKVTNPDGTVITYDHDPMGRRIAKRINGTIVEKYIWASRTRLLAVYDGNNNLVSRFTYADRRMPVSMTKSGVTYYLSYDQVGSLRAVSDGSGNIIKRIDYDSFGNILNDSNPSFKVPFGFAGGLHDRDTGLVRFGARDYDPSIGRWTAKDPIDFAGGDVNLYSYVLDNPVTLSDPNGEWILAAIAAVLVVAQVAEIIEFALHPFETEITPHIEPEGPEVVDPNTIRTQPKLSRGPRCPVR